MGLLNRVFRTAVANNAPPGVIQQAQNALHDARARLAQATQDVPAVAPLVQVDYDPWLTVVKRLHESLPRPSEALDSPQWTLAHFVELALKLGVVPVIFLRPVFGPFDATYLTENDRQP